MVELDPKIMCLNLKILEVSGAWKVRIIFEPCRVVAVTEKQIEFKNWFWIDFFLIFQNFHLSSVVGCKVYMLDDLGRKK